MRVFFENAKARKKFGTEEDIRRNFDHATARRILQRLKSIESIGRLSEICHLSMFRMHWLSGQLQGCLSIDVSANLRLVIRPDEPFARKLDGSVDLATVTNVTIIEIADTHDGKVRR